MTGVEDNRGGDTATALEIKAPDMAPDANVSKTRAAEAEAPEESANSDRAVLAVWAYIRSHAKEIALFSGSAVTTLVGAVIWVLAYFATQDQVTRLECVLSTNISIQALPLELALIKYQLDDTMSEASSLEERLKVKYTQDDQRLFVKLSNERKRLENRQERAEKELEEARAQQLACIKDSKTVEKKKP